MNTIFELLQIEPTYDFLILKENYMKKVKAFRQNKHLATTDEMKAFAQLVNCYNEVDTPEKLAFYMNMFHFDPSNKMAIHDYTEVFLTVRFDEKGKRFDPEKSCVLELPLYNFKESSPADFASTFNFAALAKVITDLSKDTPFQIGLSEEEALKIVNLHTHRDYSLVVGVMVPVASVMQRATEDTVFTGAANNKSGSNYCWLARNTLITARNIVSVRPMKADEYTNSQRQDHYQLTKPAFLWHDNMTLINQTGRVIAPIPQQLFSGAKFDDSKKESDLAEIEARFQRMNSHGADYFYFDF